MKWIICETAAAAERAAAEFIAARLREAIEARERALLAVSGGETPWRMFDYLALDAVDWEAVQLFQVDERCVPPESSERNWTRFLANRLASRIPAVNRHPAPVEIEPAHVAAQRYEQTLIRHAGEPPIIDVVHLGLGADGHTASLFAGDPLLEERARWVGISHAPTGIERLSLTLPTLNCARDVVWLVLGAERREIVTRFFNKDPLIPASHVRDAHAAVFTDAAAAPQH